MTKPFIMDVTDETFDQDVLAKSHLQPVVVDFWATWCGPCRLLGPVLEDAVNRFGGKILLAKIDTDANPNTSQKFGIQSIPAVKAFRNGVVVGGFIGYRGEKDVDTFLRTLSPTEADELCARGQSALASGNISRAVELFNDALAKEGRHAQALLGLGGALAQLGEFAESERTLLRIPVDSPEEAEAARLIAGFKLSQQTTGMLTEEQARAAIAANENDYEARFALATRLAANQHHEEAFEHFLVALKSGALREKTRESIVRMFDVMGPQNPSLREMRTRLARALY